MRARCDASAFAPARMVLLLPRGNRVRLCFPVVLLCWGKRAINDWARVSEAALRSEGRSGLSPSTHLLHQMAMSGRSELPTFGLGNRVSRFQRIPYSHGEPCSIRRWRAIRPISVLLKTVLYHRVGCQLGAKSEQCAGDRVVWTSNCTAASKALARRNRT